LRSESSRPRAGRPPAVDADAGEAADADAGDAGAVDASEAAGAGDAGKAGPHGGPERRAAAGIDALAGDLIPGFVPEGDLERSLITDPELREGLAWGKPRSGHPEGSVAAHVADLLRTIDRWGETGERRAELRFLALVHDSMKYRVRDWLPKAGENHHAMRARRLAERYTTDERLLATIEHHDRPYALWRRLRRTGRLNEKRLDGMLEDIPDIDLFIRFVELDGSTEGKSAGPIEWLREEVRQRGRGRSES
jgi:hypothetical protein